ncbi:beta-ketoacyl-[acyl-carrier-protein] synthase family protein [Actinocrispum wychmicini]|uniref:beta-ketoacyl-[acyl-carrier-protein] synthase family protein n=1 Tax=Actinocrispum wychmicini TaxID=1213861 RepID=UPI001FB79FDD|nr:beta-ketoacyl-[acyl-carrier-protein] synthase family protein [Actinocrispum wychmicini]
MDLIGTAVDAGLIRGPTTLEVLTLHEVVVTGYGVFTAFGFGAQALRARVFSGEPAFAKVRRFDPSRYRAQYAAEYQDKALSQLTVLRECVREALSSAGQDGAGAPVLLGTDGDHAANIDFWTVHAAGKQPEGAGVVHSLPGLLPEVIGEEFRLGRPRLAFVNACVAATNAIAYGAHLISIGKAHSVVCGGAYLVNEDVFAKFDSGLALTTEAVMRPFSMGRKGLLHGDGAAVLVMESAEHARRRNAVSYGSVLGWGLAADAHHPVQPHPQGRGLATAAQIALRRAGVAAEAIGYVNSHGTGTPRNDLAESLALRHVFGDRASTVPVSSTKSTTGHMLEATGAVEAVITLLALAEGLLPPTAGFLEADPECLVDCIPHTARPSQVSRALSLNAAFGGANAALVLGAPQSS